MKLNIEFRELDSDKVVRISEIDRSEEIFEQFVLKNGILETAPLRLSVKGFDPRELSEIISRQQKIITDGGSVLGAWDDQKLVGAASVENIPRGSSGQYRKMDILYVSAEYRGLGIGKELVHLCKQVAASFQGTLLYISATSTRKTVEFYLNLGAKLTTEPDAELLELEPDDIHLELDIK